MRILRMLLVVGFLIGPGAAASAAAPHVDHADDIQVYARDVFFINGSTLRHPDATTGADEPLFNVAGVALDVTWGEWSKATGRSKASVTGKRQATTTEARLTLSGLVPGGLYSVFWGTLGPDSEQPLCPNVERTLPLDATKATGAPAPNAFRADGKGNASYEGAVNQDLFAAAQVFFTVVWDFSGETSYPFANRGELLTQVPPAAECRSSFGEDTMRHLFVLQKW